MRFTCTFDRVAHRDDKTGYTVFFVLPDNASLVQNSYGQITCHGIIPEYREGIPLVLSGEIGSEGDFIVSEFCEECEEEEKAVKFLSGPYFEGVGEKMAKRLVRELGPTAFSWQDIPGIEDKMESIKGLGREAAESIIRTLRTISEFRVFMTEILKEGGLFYSARQMFEAYGIGAMERLRAMPYSGINFGLSFTSCERLARKANVHTLNDRRLLALATSALRLIESSGNTCASLKEVIKAARFLEKKAGCGRRTPAFFLSASVLKNKDAFRIVISDSEALIYRSETFMTESAVADRIKFLNVPKETGKTSPVTITEIEQKLGIKYSKEQEEAFSLLRGNGVKVLTGGPGTGKTTVLNGLIQYYEGAHPGLSISLCAPTANAAKRMRESTGRPAVTVHKLLGLRPNGAGTVRTHTKTDIPKGLVIIDEASMLDIDLALRVLDGIKPGSTLLLVGDEDQLESVGTGDVLRDLKELVPTLRLRQVYRQKEDSTILSNSIRIREGDTQLKYSDEMQAINADSDKELCDAAVDIAVRLYDRKSPGKTWLLSPVRNPKYPFSTGELNRRLQSTLNPCPLRPLYFGGKEFREGDPVQFLRNNYETGYINGDTGVIIEIDLNTRTLVVKTEEDVFSICGQDLSDIDLAYARTIHKAQGGECDNCIVLVPKEPRNMLHRKMVYVALTRAKNKNLVLTQGESLIEAIKNTNHKSRRTGLVALSNGGRLC